MAETSQTTLTEAKAQRDRLRAERHVEVQAESLRSRGSGLSRRLAPKSVVSSPQGICVSLLALNGVWLIWRHIASVGAGKTPLVQLSSPELVRGFTGLWVVGLGILILAEWAPAIAVPFAILFTIGNLLGGGAANKAATTALGRLFGTPQTVTGA